MQARLGGELARQLTAESGLSYPDYVVQPRLFELGKFLDWEKSRLSHHLTRMANRGLITKEPCDEDRRGAFIVITAQGRSAIAAAAPGHLASVRRLFIDLLTPAQIDAMAEIADTVLAEPDSCTDGPPG